MKQYKIKQYNPKYPKKFIRGTALAAAALMAVGGTGCAARTAGAPIPEPTPGEELVLDGEIGIEDIPPENLVEPGEPMVDEGDGDKLPAGQAGDDLVLDGEIAVDEYGDEYGDPLLGGEPLPDPSWEEENDPAEEPTPDEPEGRGGEPALMGKIAVPDDMP